jgi:hypothetical protein
LTSSITAAYRSQQKFEFELMDTITENVRGTSNGTKGDPNDRHDAHHPPR